MIWSNAVLCAALAVAVVTDCRRRKIYNVLTAPLALGGLVVQAFQSGTQGLASGLTGLVLLFALFALIRHFRVAQGGDVKLAAAAGAWLGFDRSIQFLMVWGLCNAIAWLIVSRRSFDSWAAWWAVQRVSLQGLQVGVLHGYGAVSYPGAVTITMSTVIALLL